MTPSSPTCCHVRHRIDTPIDHLPDEVIELILSKCPVKSVVRFKSVSKSWQSIISDPRFSKIHRINRWKMSENQNKFMLLSCVKALKAHHVYLIRWEEDGIFRTESMLPYPYPLIFNIPLGSCNGLILFAQKGNNHYFLLWNPSIRKHVFISGPHNCPDHPLHLSHFYYDSMTDDYKIVFVYKTSYTVYSCKKRSWSEMKGLPCDRSLMSGIGVSVDGCFYGCVLGGAIVCFDTRDGSVHKFRQPKDAVSGVALREVSGRLYFIGYLKHGKGLEMWAMEKHGCFVKWGMDKNRSLKKWCGVFDWRKFINMEQEEVAQICLSNTNIWGLRLTKEVKDNPRKFISPYRFDSCSPIFSYSENLYMP